MEIGVNHDIDVDINNVCRACLSSEKTSYVEEGSKNYEYFTSIFESLSIPAKEMDTILLLCDSCLERLNDIKSFRDMCLRSHRIIKSVLNEDTHLTGDTRDNTGGSITHIEFLEIRREYSIYENQNKNGLNECPPELNDEVEIKEETDSNTITSVEKGIKCNVCGGYFASNEEVGNHILSVHGANDYKCSECEEVFMDRSSLIEHNKIHEKRYVNARYACKHCDKSYTSHLNLKIHLYNHTGVKPFKCAFCCRGFTRKSTLKAHLTIHTGIRDFLCSECGKGFTSAMILNRHKMRHTGDKPFKCKLCPSAFISAQDLNIHMRSHTGEKPYLCSTCGNSFSRSSHLTVHRRTHTGEKPYVCGTCGHSFAQSGDLRSHERTHTGEKPYTCTICSKKFNQCSGYSTHMKKHAEQLHSCEVCLKMFTLASTLAKHKRTHHKQ